jgi:hypothetical protein
MGGFIAMWHTSRGDRTLRGSEAALVGNAIDTMIDTLMLHFDIDSDVDLDCQDLHDPNCDSGISVYDAFSPPQRIGLLHEVAQYLLRETDEALPLSAALEATIAAIFVEVRDQVAIEISLFGSRIDEGQTNWRQLVLDAYQSVRLSEDDGSDEHRLPYPGCVDVEQWDGLVESLTDAVLWDRDFEMADTFLDIDPGVSQQRRQLLGINDEYFTTVAPDPRPRELEHLISATRDIVRAKPR